MGTIQKCRSEYREAVATQSPGLLQPWVNCGGSSTQNGLRRSGSLLAKIVEVLSGIVHDVRTVGRNRVAVDSIKHILPRVEATLGFET